MTAPVVTRSARTLMAALGQAALYPAPAGPAPRARPGGLGRQFTAEHSAAGRAAYSRVRRERIADFAELTDPRGLHGLSRTAASDRMGISRRTGERYAAALAADPGLADYDYDDLEAAS